MSFLPPTPIPYAAFQEQSTEYENRLKTDRLKRFDESNKFQFKDRHRSATEKAFKEFKHALTFPQSTLDECAAKALKSEANEAMNKLALDPSSDQLNQKFHDTQRKLRQWRGNYIKDKIIQNDDKNLNDFLQRTQPNEPNAEGHNYHITFSMIQYDNIDFRGGETVEEISKMSKCITTFQCNITHNDIRFDDKNIDATDIIQIIGKMNMTQIEDNFPKEAIDKLIQEIESQITSKQVALSTHLGAPFDETSTFAVKSLPQECTVMLDGSPFYYKIKVNKIMPTVSRIYHNPKVIQKMIVDFLGMPVPPMQVSLIIRNHDFIFQWIVHRIKPNTHTVYHLTYTDPYTSGLFALPDDLLDIKEQFKGSNFYGTRQYDINSNDLNLQSDPKILYLHSQLIQSIIYSEDFNANSSKQLLNVRDFQEYDFKMNEQYGYIYEFGEYTIVANSIIGRRKDPNFLQSHFTSYTIIHWNPNILKKTANTNSNNYSNLASVYNSQMQIYNHRLFSLQESFRHIQKEMVNFQVFKYKPELLSDSVTEGLDYYIPAIFEEFNYAKNAYKEESPYIPSKNFVGLNVISPSFKERTLLESKRYELQSQFITKLLSVTYIKLRPNEKLCEALWRCILAFMMTTEEKNKGLIEGQKLFQRFPGWVGNAIIRIHKGEFYNDKTGQRNVATDRAEKIEAMLPYIKAWTLKWTLFLDENRIRYEKKPIQFFIDQDIHRENVVRIQKISAARVNRQSANSHKHSGSARGGRKSRWEDNENAITREAESGDILDFENTENAPTLTLHPASSAQQGSQQRETVNTWRKQHPHNKNNAHDKPRPAFKVPIANEPGTGKRARRKEARQTVIRRPAAAQQSTVDLPTENRQERRHTQDQALAVRKYNEQTDSVSDFYKSRENSSLMGGNRNWTDGVYDNEDEVGSNKDEKAESAEDEKMQRKYQSYRAKGYRQPSVSSISEGDEKTMERKYQSEIDSLKRTVNELVLRSQFNVNNTINTWG